MSTSWSDTEWNYPQTDIAAIDAALKEAAAQGQAVFTSSGDHGAYSDPTRPKDLSVRFPGSDPWVTSVGGTTLLRNGNGTWSEYAWADSSSSADPVGGGGGLSTLFSRPDYQSGPGVSRQYSNGMRQMPDVAANADFRASGFAIYESDNNQSPQWYSAGGTSASAPLWASAAVLANQHAGSRLGFFNPLLYALGGRDSTLDVKPFRDVTQGTNLYYPAGPGWDFASGWGSFNAANFLADLGLVSQGPTPTSTPVAPRSTVQPPTSSPSVGRNSEDATPLPTLESRPTDVPQLASVSLHINSLAVYDTSGHALTVAHSGQHLRAVAVYTVRDLSTPGSIQIVRQTSVSKVGKLAEVGESPVHAVDGE